MKCFIFLPFFCLLSLTGCYTGIRLQDTGNIPPLTRTQDPTAYPDYQPVHMPMPAVTENTYQPNSLWRTGARSFFQDQRASKVGDIVTILIELDEKVETKNETSGNRESKSSLMTPHVFGYEGKLKNIFPQGVDPSNLLDTSSKPEFSATSKISRKDKVKFKIAAIVTQMLPSGKLVIMGRQELRVNFEVRDLLITGIIQPQDISASNEITSDKVAEARFSYGGRGELSDLQKRPYGHTLMSNLMPF
jgi:flagellar L-ring protein precursor FlgH